MSNENSTFQIENLTAEQIKNMTSDLRKEAQNLGKEHDLIEKSLNSTRIRMREIITSIPEISELAKKRVEFLEKRRRL